MSYYRLDDRTDEPDKAALGEVPDLEIDWNTGAPYTAAALPDPIRCALDRNSGSTVPDLFLGRIPIFSYRLLAALDAAGIDNLERFNLELSDPRAAVHHDYKAVNVIGAIACVDWAKSTVGADQKFQRLAIDAAHAGGRALFRLAEDRRFILVDDGVKLALEEAALSGVAIRALDDPRAY